ncbi:unnamed protein product [Anisakis simplex]|uniref:Acyl-CoA_dh_N domain-containing protein n=1 Tax=Anisakis simplex TaxID=6269 RepID=A0A0M3JCW2_ANISI|nr:unnamed protein product [Anisakis simplex]
MMNQAMCARVATLKAVSECGRLALRSVASRTNRVCTTSLHTATACCPLATQKRLQPQMPQLIHKRFSQIEVFGPFEPPKQLTIKEVRALT